MCVTASFADNEINPENKPAEEEMGEPMDWYDEESEFEALFSVTGDDILSSAMRYIGTPYRMGSTGPSSFDCSGFTSYVYRQMNINLNRTSRASTLRVWQCRRMSFVPATWCSSAVPVLVPA